MIIKRRSIFMDKEIKGIVNLILAVIGLAMGVAVIVLSIVDSEIVINNLVRMLGIAVASLGLFAINNLPKK
jgi:hypothetical protein